jgi:inner membrane protein
MGYIIYRLFRYRVPKQFNKPRRLLPLLLIIAVGISLLPDIDSVAGILTGDFGRYHNNFTHSLFVGIGVAFIFAISVWVIIKIDFWVWFVICFLGYSLHIVMDFITFGGRGVMLFWPLSLDRFESPVKIFYGVRWSEGVMSPVHLNTIINEVVFVLLVGIILLIVEKRRTMTKNKGISNSWE